MSFNIDKMISPFIKALPPSGLAKFLEITANNPNIVPLSVESTCSLYRQSECREKQLYLYTGNAGTARSNSC